MPTAPAIVVVDDAPGTLHVVGECLFDAGYRIAIAGDLDAAATLLPHMHFAMAPSDTRSACTDYGLGEPPTSLRRLRAAAGAPLAAVATAHRSDEYADDRARGFASLPPKSLALDELRPGTGEPRPDLPDRRESREV